MTQKLLKFSKGNAKLDSRILTFSLPSGFTCPAAFDCLSFADKETGKIKDGAHTQFRCFAASMESRLPALRKNVWHNLELLKAAKSVDNMTKLINESLVAAKLPKFSAVRIHVAGDYFNEQYFQAWRNVAAANKDKIFYGYTKRVDLLVKHGQVKDNHRVVASYGGKFDKLVDCHKLICAKVVFSEQEAKDNNLEIDHDDSHAISCDKSFGLLIHGIQPAGSPAAKAVSTLKKNGWNGYGNKN